jgi:hypothetical protein
VRAVREKRRNEAGAEPFWSLRQISFVYEGCARMRLCCMGKGAFYRGERRAPRRTLANRSVTSFSLLPSVKKSKQEFGFFASTRTSTRTSRRAF